MFPEHYVLMITAISVGFIHTLTGPDHYLPFVALSKIHNWSLTRTIIWVLACGCGHVWSSVLLGLGGAAFGWSLTKIDGLENIRGGLAGWALLFIGIFYFFWGMITIKKDRKHKHFEWNDENSLYVFEHRHANEFSGKRHKVTPWVMFLIFLLGPCEPMIPLLFYPGANGQLFTIFILILVYTVVTLFTMLAMVLLLRSGIGIFFAPVLEKYMHPIGGLTIVICAFSMIFLGW